MLEPARDRDDVEIAHRFRPRAEDGRGDADDHPIGESRLQERRYHAGASLDEHGANAEATEQPQRLGGVHAGGMRADGVHGNTVISKNELARGPRLRRGDDHGGGVVFEYPRVCRHP